MAGVGVKHSEGGWASNTCGKTLASVRQTFSQEVHRPKVPVLGSHQQPYLPIITRKQFQEQAPWVQSSPDPLTCI